MRQGNWHGRTESKGGAQKRYTADPVLLHYQISEGDHRMTARKRLLTLLLAALITLPVTGAWRGAQQVFHCCGLPSNIRTGNDGLPADAAPASQQTLTIAEQEYPYFDWEQTAYNL